MAESDKLLESGSDQSASGNGDGLGDKFLTKRGVGGLSMGMAALFLAGEMAGAGILNLPAAIRDTGWFGIMVLIYLGVSVTYAGTKLGECWTLLEEKHPKYKTSACRNPYPVIVHHALGPCARYIVEVSLHIGLYGTATVYLLLCADILRNLLFYTLPGITKCSWSLFLGFALIPLTWMGTPKDFWPLSIGATLTTVVAVVIVIIQVIVDSYDRPLPNFPKPSFKSFFLGFGSILFSLGGASTFPTIQNDMKDRSEFSKSVIIAFSLLGVMYIFVSCISYGLLGDSVEENILFTMHGMTVDVILVFIFLHFVFAFNIVVNPIMQRIEDVADVPMHFCMERCIVRTLIMFGIIVTGLAIPTFNKILDLIGGSVVSLLSFVIPPWCYINLVDLNKVYYNRNFCIPKRALLISTMFIGVLGGVISTWNALAEIVDPSAFNQTCFSTESFFPVYADDNVTAITF